jgi:uncharacterized membrane protein
MSKIVVATFQNYADAEKSARRVKEEGLRTDDISIITKTQGEGQQNWGGNGNNANVSMKEQGWNEGRRDDISDGIVAGGVLGGLAGILIGAGTMIIPGLGAIAAAGPITGLLSGAVTGGIVGGLVDLGIPEDQSKRYQDEVRKGKVLFSMNTEDNNVQRVTQILEKNGALRVDSYGVRN